VLYSRRVDNQIPPPSGGYNLAMFRLTREVRLAVNSTPDGRLSGKPANSHAGFPSLTGFGQFFSLSVTLRGELRPESSYLRNIKDVDDAVRRIGIPILQEGVRANGRPVGLLVDLRRALAESWPGTTLDALGLSLSPFLSLSARAEESPMVRLSQKFEFSASHRLFNPELGDEENRKVFGKCSNPHGHGHNYELQVTLAGAPDRIDGVLANLPDFERIIGSAVVDRFDHKNLNVDVPEFEKLIPSVENIARVIYGILRPKFADAGARLASITVWETPKTWCEYSE
jgi:6-pyruvoyltetrahydropterin/6-carboxytetrahydropterin synthase